MRSKLLTFSFALFASLCLWLYVVTVVNPEATETYYDIPVVFSGEEDIRADTGLIITDGSVQTVTLKLTGKRIVLEKLASENMTVRVDVSTIKKVGEYTRSYEIVYPADVANSEVQAERAPTQVKFTVEKLATKTIDVKGVFDGKAAEGYMQEEMQYDFDQIVIEGPSDVVSQVSYAQVILSLTDLTESVTQSLPYTLIDAGGNPVENPDITSEVKEIKVTLPIVRFAEIPLVMSFAEGGGATADNVEYEVTPATITVSGDAAVLAEMTEIVLGKVELAKFTESKPLYLPIEMPDGIKNISGEETAEVTIRIKGLETKSIRASNIGFINIPDGLIPTSMTQMLQITVRAPTSEIARISAADLQVEADLSLQNKEGTFVVPVTVDVVGFDKAGVVGEYTIVVSLTKE